MCRIRQENPDPEVNFDVSQDSSLAEPPPTASQRRPWGKGTTCLVVEPSDSLLSQKESDIAYLPERHF